jgi:hypothetical protein
MRARSAALVLALLSACAGLTTSGPARAPESRAQNARPELDPALIGTPQGATALLPIEQVSVRVQRASDGRVTIIEFLSPGLPEAEQVAVRLALEAGELRLANPGAAGEESWVTNLQRSRTR